MTKTSFAGKTISSFIRIDSETLEFSLKGINRKYRITRGIHGIELNIVTIIQEPKEVLEVLELFQPCSESEDNDK